MNHIKSIQDEEKSWCGITLGIDFYYKSVDQAAIAGLLPEPKAPCPVCVNQCVTLLLKTINGEYYEQKL